MHVHETVSWCVQQNETENENVVKDMSTKLYKVDLIS